MCRGYGHTATLKRRVIAQRPYFLTGLQPVLETKRNSTIIVICNFSRLKQIFSELTSVFFNQTEAQARETVSPSLCQLNNL